LQRGAHASNTSTLGTSPVSSVTLHLACAQPSPLWVVLATGPPHERVVELVHHILVHLQAVRKGGGKYVCVCVCVCLCVCMCVCVRVCLHSAFTVVLCCSRHLKHSTPSACQHQRPTCLHSASTVVPFRSCVSTTIGSFKRKKKIGKTMLAVIATVSDSTAGKSAGEAELSAGTRPRPHLREHNRVVEVWPGARLFSVHAHLRREREREKCGKVNYTAP